MTQWICYRNKVEGFDRRHAALAFIRTPEAAKAGDTAVAARASSL